MAGATCWRADIARIDAGPCCGSCPQPSKNVRLKSAKFLMRNGFYGVITPALMGETHRRYCHSASVYGSGSPLFFIPGIRPSRTCRRVKLTLRRNGLRSRHAAAIGRRESTHSHIEISRCLAWTHDGGKLERTRTSSHALTIGSRKPAEAS